MPRRKQITYSQHPNRAARAAHAKGDKAFRTYDTSAIRPKRNPAFAVAGIIVLIVALVAIVFGVMSFMRACGAAHMLPEGEEVQITVVEGEGAKSVAKNLADEGVIANANELTDRLNALGSDVTIQPGTYTFRGGQSVDEIIQVLQTPVAATTFTVPEGSTIDQTAQIVAEATHGNVSADDFKAAASNVSAYVDSYDFLAGVDGGSLEGFLFPKTYPFDDQSTADSIVRMMLDQFGAETASLDLSYVTERGLGLYDALKLASIVEKEADQKNRSTVASVFYNRMDNGMRLQSDATVAYFVGHDPTPEDVDTYSDYNTYMIDGLPPTPINSPSLDCLQAVCKPDETPYLYFYFESDGSGGMNYYFSETYEEHQATYE